MKKMFTLFAALAMVMSMSAETWTVAGAPASVFNGQEWSKDAAANDMIKQADGTYKWEKADLTLAVGTIQFKVLKDHNWDEAYPSNNYELPIDKSGKYTITITFNASTKEVSAKATLQEEVEVIPVITLHSNFEYADWGQSEEFAIADDKKTATLSMTIEAKSEAYEFGVKKDGVWYSNGSAITRANPSAQIVAGEGNSTLMADVTGDYIFTWTYETNTLSVTYPNATQSAVDNVMVEQTTTKIIRNGQMYILREGVMYNALGQIAE